MRFLKLKQVSVVAAYLLAVMGLYTPSASAQWYASGSGGLTIVDDADLNDTFAGGSATSTADFDEGYAISGALGYAWKNFRLEGEASYRQADIDQLSVDSFTVGGAVFTGLGTFDVSGDTSALSFMANGWYDFDTGSKWVPYLGAGLGIARVNLDIETVGGVAAPYDESDTVFAYQVGGGIGYKVTEKTTMSLGYTYFATVDPSYDDGVDQIDGELSTHNIMLGVVHRF